MRLPLPALLISWALAAVAGRALHTVSAVLGIAIRIHDGWGRS